MNGSLSEFDTLAKIALELENIGKSGDLKEGAGVLEKLEREFHRLEDYTKKQNVR